MKFKILKKSKISRARIGVIETKHGAIETPCFVPVATQGTVKALESSEVLKTKSQILIANAFHLHLRPGEKIIKASGGLHKYMNWQKPLMTDSGGFQVFSLGFGKDFGIGKILKSDTNTRIHTNDTNDANIKKITIGQQPKLLKITEKGVWFTSYIDGKKIFLGPKESIKIQEKIKADIIFAFDECPPPNADYKYNKKAMERTHRWAIKSLKAKSSKLKAQSIYGIVQGGRFKDLRIESARFISSLDFDGFGIGGEFGENQKGMANMLKWVMNELPENKPRHLLGVGYLDDILNMIKSGVDTFDCTVPTHYARHGYAFISQGKLDMSKSIFLNPPAGGKNPLDKNCDCMVCQNYTRSYISHLYKAHEITALNLLTFHNLYFFNSYIEKIREGIKQGKI